jgi:hypothetical protein
MTHTIQERRRFSRSGLPAGLGVHVLQPHATVAADSVNVSDGGLCLRLEERLEVRSLVRLQVTPRSGAAPSRRPVECTGRVAWVIQRLDLREVPPFLFDIGIEFVDPPQTLRQLLLRRGGMAALKRRLVGRARVLEPAMAHGRRFVPRIEKDAAHSPPWHLVVTVDDVPCFSGRFGSERATIAAWERFRRRQARAKRGAA